MNNLRRHPFPANSCVVISGICANGEYGAFVEGDERKIKGYGYNRFSAIADLVEMIAKTDEESEEMFSEAAE